MSAFYKFVKAVVTPLACLFFNVKKYGTENIPKDEAVVLCCNHTSMTDVWLLIALCPRQICFMAKKELFEIPVLKHIFAKMGAFPVDRKSSDKGALIKAQEICKNGGILGIFPEGTRTLSGAPKKAKPGAALIALQTNSKILPVSVYRGNKPVRPFQKATVRFGEVIETENSGENISRNDIKNYTELITQKITELWEKKH
jgi:1-acyl-sn-glycerol-3-phosphate acyltransferase